jgi:hypothetical protein
VCFRLIIGHDVSAFECFAHQIKSEPSRLQTPLASASAYLIRRRSSFKCHSVNSNRLDIAGLRNQQIQDFY